MTELAEGLGRALGEAWGRKVAIGGLSQSTAGARRTNLIFTADGVPYVATIVPSGLQSEAGEGKVSSVSTEAAVRDLAEQAGVVVPHVEFVTDDPAYVGGPFMVSVFAEGETVPRRVLRLVDEHGIGDRLAQQIGASLARLHSIDVADAPAGLLQAGDHPTAAALAKLSAAVAAMRERRPVLEFGLRWMEANLPDPPARPAIVHGDVRNGNLIVGPDGLRAILDWEIAVAGGDPMEDLAWPTQRMWRFGNDDREVGGFAGRQALIDGYVDAGGTFDAARFAWWRVARTVWWAVGLAGQAESFLSGAVPSIVMAASGRRVSELEWDLLMLLRPQGG